MTNESMPTNEYGVTNPSDEAIAAVARGLSLDPYTTQVGGDHYKKYAIQPAYYIIANNLTWAEGSVIAYVTRWKDKGGLDDLRKARHTLDLYISQLEAAGVR